MGIIDIFSKRTKQKNNNIFIYDKIPSELRVQVIHIWADSIGQYQPLDYFGGGGSPSNQIWEYIHSQLCREYGIFSLHDRGKDPFLKCQYFIQEAPVERVLDVIEMSFRCIDALIREWNPYQKSKARIKQNSDGAIDELNRRFREHGIGFQYISGNIVRIDSEYIYQEAVKPAVKLMFDEGFQGASEEFLSAHEHFRKGRYKEAIVDALKAFESVMKTICKRMGWEISENATARPLIDCLFKNHLIPLSLQNQFNSLRSTLESGLPTVRNKTSGHGQGEYPTDVPPHMVAYALNLAATNIVFLIESYKATNK